MVFDAQNHCPCDGGDSPPDFVGEDYFCEASVETIDFPGPGADTLLANNVLWDGENCGTHGDCCTRLSRPYFVKQLEKPTTDDIDLRMCNFSGDEGCGIGVSRDIHPVKPQMPRTYLTIHQLLTFKYIQILHVAIDISIILISFCIDINFLILFA